MAIINFIIHLGIIIVIFGFIWGFFRIVFNMILGGSQTSNKTQYLLQITKNVFLVSVTANFVFQTNPIYGTSIITKIIISCLILSVYFLEKMQNRNKYAQISAMGGGFLKNFSSNFNTKQEHFLLFGSLGFYFLCLVFPFLTNNLVLNWFVTAIEGLNNAFLIGFIFKIIAFFTVLNLILRLSNIIGKLVNGYSLKDSFTKKQNASPFGNFSQFSDFGNFQNQQNTNTVENEYYKKANSNINDEGFTEYEDVTEE